MSARDQLYNARPVLRQAFVRSGLIRESREVERLDVWLMRYRVRPEKREARDDMDG